MKDHKRILHRLLEVEDKLDHLIAHVKSLEEKIMSLADDLRTGLAKLDTETTAIGNLITSLAAKIHNSMTDAEVAEVKGSLDTLSNRLTNLAVDPTNPVPPEPAALAALKQKHRP